VDQRQTVGNDIHRCRTLRLVHDTVLGATGAVRRPGLPALCSGYSGIV
jgi:hypothetical protein